MNKRFLGWAILIALIFTIVPVGVLTAATILVLFLCGIIR